MPRLSVDIDGLHRPQAQPGFADSLYAQFGERDDQFGAMMVPLRPPPPWWCRRGEGP